MQVIFCRGNQIPKLGHTLTVEYLFHEKDCSISGTERQTGIVKKIIKLNGPSGHYAYLVITNKIKYYYQYINN